MHETIVRDHRALIALADTLDALVSAGVPDDERIADCRWTLARLVMNHLSVEERHVQLHLDRARPRGVDQTTRSLRSGVDSLHAQFSEHLTRFAPDAIAGDWPEYRAHIGALTAALRERIAQEEAAIVDLRARAAG